MPVKRKAISSVAQPTARPIVWIVQSDFTGETNARTGVAERLGFGHESIPRPNGHLRHYINERQRQFHTTSTHPAKAPLVLISGTGEDTVSDIADFKDRFDGQIINVFLASILPNEVNPRLFEYDIIATPQLERPDVISTLGVAHQVTMQRIADSERSHQHLFRDLISPVFALLVGGNTLYCDGFDALYASQLGKQVKAVVKGQNGSLLVTNSRRTPPIALQALLEELDELKPRFFDWEDSPDDLYWAMLGRSDAVIATGDSLSMCSEAVFTGKPLLVDISKRATECYHRTILGRLIEHGAARLLSDGYSPWSYAPIDTTGQIAEAIRRKLAMLRDP